jgi:hypothetical protein
MGDHDLPGRAHQAIPEAMWLSGLQTGDDVEGVWLYTDSISEAANRLEFQV